MLLFTPPKLAVTLICVPTAAAAEMAPVVLPLVRVRSVGLELFQVTDVVIFCCVPLLGKVAMAKNVTVLFTGGNRGFAVKRILVGVPSVTVTVVLAGVAVLKEALICVVQTPATVLSGVTMPLLLMEAQVGVVEPQRTFPVKSRVEPSLKVPVADICRVCTGLAVRVGVCGPIAIDDKVGLTKKPVHPTAVESARTMLTDRRVRLELRMFSKPLNEGLHKLARISLENCSRQNLHAIGTCTIV